MNRKFYILISCLVIPFSAKNNMKSLSRLIIICILSTLFLFAGCSGRYFRPSDHPPLPPKMLRLSEWPYKEYWTGIVFNGKRVGFSHFKRIPARGSRDVFEIHSSAYLHVRLLMFDKIIKLKSFDRVAADLSLVDFRYTYDFDGNQLQLEGRQNNQRPLGRKI